MMENDLFGDISGAGSYSEDDRRAIAQMLMNLFEIWQLDTESQLILLGHSITSRAMLSKYRQGSVGIANSQDSLDRAGLLLSIFRALEHLYPQNSELRRTWIMRRNRAFNQLTPLNVMLEQGLLGLATVAKYLQHRQLQ